ncbi:cell wall hydrolase [Aquella oligotrophica]|uniref:Cell wall hydrolase SleB domain-containing protein n=1 Tax=Aquella oligotrophica TaxID=2067065 RepID=A0A2I7N4V4_9NEIS|nr:cell wall hydrolase [Aquella oligotrophica]AUR51489.1 hypothetical protein CUN60_04020 [Aquella oligotrophica]
MLVVTASLCMAINLYKECRSASDKECQLVNRVVINRMHDSHKTACDIIFAKNQFSWTNSTQKKLQFNSYNDMLAYYKIDDSTQLVRAFENINKSQDQSNQFKTPDNMIYYYDKSIVQPRWAQHMQVAYKTKKFIFYNA